MSKAGGTPPSQPKKAGNTGPLKATGKLDAKPQPATPKTGKVEPALKGRLDALKLNPKGASPLGNLGKAADIEMPPETINGGGCASRGLGRFDLNAAGDKQLDSRLKDLKKNKTGISPLGKLGKAADIEMPPETINGGGCANKLLDSRLKELKLNQYGIAPLGKLGKAADIEMPPETINGGGCANKQLASRLKELKQNQYGIAPLGKLGKAADIEMPPETINGGGCANRGPGNLGMPGKPGKPGKL